MFCIKLSILMAFLTIIPIFWKEQHDRCLVGKALNTLECTICSKTHKFMPKTIGLFGLWTLNGAVNLVVNRPLRTSHHYFTEDEPPTNPTFFLKNWVTFLPFVSFSSLSSLFSLFFFNPYFWGILLIGPPAISTSVPMLLTHYLCQTINCWCSKQFT